MRLQTGFFSFPHSERDLAPRGRLNQEQAADAFAIRMDVSIQADTRRLFHALTDPEYVEAWMSMPGHHPACSLIAGKYDRDYFIEHCCEGGRQSILISGRYLVLRRHHVMFSWRVDGNICVPETEVEIRLRGDFERTTLLLRHSGFTSRREAEWHRALWNTSISALAGLYAKPDRLRSSADRERGRIMHDPRFEKPRRRTICD